MIAALALGCTLAAPVDIKAWAQYARRLVLALHTMETRPSPPGDLKPQAVFVTIEDQGKVVGCRGSLQVRGQSLAQSIEMAANEALVGVKALKSPQVSLTVVERLEQIDSVRSLLPTEGLVLRQGSKIGVVLPYEGKLPGVRLEWAYRKAGVQAGASVSLHKLIGERAIG